MNILGSRHRTISFRFNNRPINDMQFGAYNIDMFPIDFLENTEVLIGSDAVIFSNNSSGALINFQEVSYNTATPYTKLRIYESGTTFIASDGVFSQNILKNVNFTFGFRKLNSSDEYQNQWTDAWNLRGLVRWNISNFTNISLSESFYNHAMGTNGGINTDLTENIFSPREAVPLYSDFNERVIRHDLTLTLSSILAEDSSSAFSMSAFITTADWYRRVPGIIFGSDSIQNDSYISNFFGITGKFEQELTKYVSLKFGGDIQISDIQESLFTEELSGLSMGGFGHVGFRPTQQLLFSGGIRINSQLERFYSSLGGKIEYFLQDNSSFFGDVSISQRIPSPAEGLNLKNENHFLLIAGINKNFFESGISTSLFYRTVKNPINGEIVYDADGNIINTSSVQGDVFTSAGFHINYNSSVFKNLFYRINGYLTFENWSESANFSEPGIYAGINVFYRISFGRSEVRFGFELNSIWQDSWLRYLPQKRQYTYTNQEGQFFYDGIKVFAHAKLGNAYLKLSIQNILDPGYYYTAFYPAPGMKINIGLNWAFLD